MGGRRLMISSRGRLRLHKAARIIVAEARACTDEDLRKSLQHASGLVLSALEYVQLIDRYRKKDIDRMIEDDNEDLYFD